MDRQYVRDGNQVGYVVESGKIKGITTLYFSSFPLSKRVVYDVTVDEIKEFEAKEREIKERREKEYAKEAELLSLCDLKHDDFVRFRGIYIENGLLCVHTRENGVNERSVSAIRNKNYLNSCADDFDSTYEHYEFIIPTKGAE